VVPKPQAALSKSDPSDLKTQSGTESVAGSPSKSEDSQAASPASTGAPRPQSSSLAARLAAATAGMQQNKQPDSGSPNSPKAPGLAVAESARRNIGQALEEAKSPTQSGLISASEALKKHNKDEKKAQDDVEEALAMSQIMIRRQEEAEERLKKTVQIVEDTAKGISSCDGETAATA